MSTPVWLRANLTMDCLIQYRTVTGTDEYGNDTYSYVDNLTRCFLQPVSEAEIQAGRAGVGTFLLHLPAEVAGLVDSYTRFVVGGVPFEADGPAALYTALHRTGVHHVEFTVVRSRA